MAVPSSGNSLSLASIRGEVTSNSYSAVTNVSTSLQSMSTSVNTNFCPHPNKIAPHKMSEFYSYDNDGPNSTGSNTFYYDSNSSIDACLTGASTTLYFIGCDTDDPFTNNRSIYTNSSRTTLAAAGYYLSSITSYVNLWTGSSWASFDEPCFP